MGAPNKEADDRHDYDGDAADGEKNYQEVAAAVTVLPTLSAVGSGAVATQALIRS